MNSTCPICGGTLGEGRLNDDYLECTRCHTQLKKESVLNLTEEPKYFNNVEPDLVADKKHYDDMLERLARKPRFFNRLRRFRKTATFDEVYCMGGGFPKLESYFTSRRIVIFDLAAEQYVRFIDLFRRIYGSSAELDYRKYFIFENTSIYDDVLSKIEPSKKALISFVHFLEHVTPRILLNVLGDLKRARREGMYFMIYQPNAAAAQDREWHHYGAHDHITLIPLDTLVKKLGDEGFEVVYASRFSDDMLIIFR